MKKILKMLLLAALICVFPAGCTIENRREAQTEQEETYSYFYLNTGETSLRQQAYQPQEETLDFMMPDLMMRITAREVPEDGTALLPENVSVNSYDLQENLLVIDFNGAYLEMSRGREVLTRAGIVETFMQIPGIEAVRFTVDGQELTDSRNQPVGDMTESSFVQLSGKNEDAYRTDTIVLYFTDENGKKLLREERTVRYRHTISKEILVLEQLAKGPSVEGHYATLPDDALPINAVTADGICYINMAGAFQENTMEVSENTQIYSIVNSIVDSCGAERVQISVEGNQEGNLKSSMPLYTFYEKNEELIAEEETAEE